MTVTSTLFKAARLSASLRALSRGPTAIFKRLVRIAVGRSWARSGAPRWPK
jgi:hypothetical protein